MSTMRDQTDMADIVADAALRRQSAPEERRSPARYHPMRGNRQAQQDWGRARGTLIVILVASWLVAAAACLFLPR
jgi:hypothetical protein